MVLLLLDTGLKLLAELASRGGEKTALLLVSDLVESNFPLRKLFKHCLNLFEVLALFFEVFKVKISVEVVDIAARFEHFSLLLNMEEVGGNALVDLGAHFCVLLRIFDNAAEAKTVISDKTVHVLVELAVVDHALHLLSHDLHIVKKLLDVAFKLNFGGSVTEAIFGGVIEADDGLNGVLTVLAVHLVHNNLTGFLINSDLGLNNHVIDEADEGSQVVEVEPC